MHNVAEQKNIPAPESGRDAADSALSWYSRCGACATRILIHADLAAVFSGAAVIAARWQEKSPSRRPGRGVWRTD